MSINQWMCLIMHTFQLYEHPSPTLVQIINVPLYCTPYLKYQITFKLTVYLTGDLNSLKHVQLC